MIERVERGKPGCVQGIVRDGVGQEEGGGRGNEKEVRKAARDRLLRCW